MRDMNEKKLYIWRLANFLSANNMRMSGEELAEHLNRNNILTGYGTEYSGGRGTYSLIRATWEWVDGDLRLPDESRKIAEAYVTSSGSYAYQVSENDGE